MHEFHLLRDGAAAALLKTVEEPPPSTVFLILADDIPPELVTIASRCLRIDFRPVPDELVVAALVRDGVSPDAASLARVERRRETLDRARLLAADAGLAARRRAFHDVPTRLDGTGSSVAGTVDELIGFIDAAAEPLKVRQVGELADLDRRAGEVGERAR